MENAPPPRAKVFSFHPPPWASRGQFLGRLDPDLCVLRKTTAGSLMLTITKQELRALVLLTQKEGAENMPILQMGTGRLRAVDQYSLEVIQWHHW